MDRRDVGLGCGSATKNAGGDVQAIARVPGETESDASVGFEFCSWLTRTGEEG